MNITVRVIPHSKQRYETVGDWQFINGDLLISVSDTGDTYFNYLIARHEMDEAMLCLKNGVTDEDVTSYDKSNPETAGNDCLSDNLASPYYEYHNDALASEWQFARLLGVDWGEYTKKVENL